MLGESRQRTALRTALKTAFSQSRQVRDANLVPLKCFPPPVNTPDWTAPNSGYTNNSISGGPGTELDTVKQLNQNGVTYDLILAGT